MKATTKTKEVKEVKKLTNKEVKRAIEAKVKLTKEQITEKRKLNPQFSHVVSKQKKIDFLEFRKNGLKVFLNTKSIVKNIEIEGYNFVENLNLIEKSISFINFVTKTNKANEFANENLLKPILENVRLTKNGLYNEFYFAQFVQKIVTLSINKGIDYQTAINLIITKKQK